MSKRAKKPRGRPPNLKPRKRSPGLVMNLLLIISLLPIVGGLLLLIGIPLNIMVWEPVWTQVTIGSLAILFSFIASNALRQEWTAAAGWLLLALPVGLYNYGPPLSIVSLIGGALGVFLLVSEFLQQIQQSDQGKK